MPKIHAAANRIPVLRTNTALKNYPELNDREPASLDHFPAHTWSGSIRFSITAKTPLVYGSVDEETNSISIPTEILDGSSDTPKEIPVLPATMVKSMLSNAFERVTTSRLRIFGNYSDPLTYRTDPAASQKLIPAIVDPSKSKALLLTGTHPRLAEVDILTKNRFEKRLQTIPVMRAATLRTEPGGQIEYAPGMTHESLLDMILPSNGAVSRKIRFDAKLVNNGSYAYWFIYALYSDDDDERKPIFNENALTGEDLGETLTKQAGYVYLTTDPEDLGQHRRTFNKKVSERVFFIEDEQARKDVTIPQTTTDHPSPIDRYLLTVQSYVDNWLDELERDPETTRTPNRFIRQHKAPHLKPPPSFLAYILVSKDLSGDETVDTIVPISIGRDAYALSPLTVARRANVAPPQNLSELSPADRLFGFVAHCDNMSQKTEEKSSLTPSFKGRIFVTKVDYAGGGGVANPSTLRLRPLLSPRPSSARRFLTRTNGANLNSVRIKVRRDQYFSHDPEQSLGATTYPVDRNAWESVDKKTGFPEKALKRASDSLKTTSEVKKYVKAGTKFDATMRFEALTEFELAWLLWILDSANLVPRAERQKPMSSAPSDKVGYLRLGTGKPLGLGVVQIDLSPNGFQASETIGGNTGTPSLFSAYTELTGCLGTVVTTTDPAQFQVPKHYLKTPWVDAFQRSCFGYDDRFDVRHFTLDENKENNRTDSETGLPINGAGVEPGILWGSQSDVPIVVPERRKKERR
jgi:hypothetical protein